MPDTAAPAWGISDRAAALHRAAIVWDNVFPYEPWVGNDLAALDRFRGAGYTMISLTIAGDNHNVAQAVQRLAEIRRLLASRADDFVLVLSVGDVLQAKAEGKLGVGLHFEGCRCLERNLDMIAAYYAFGVRHNLLAFNQANSVGGGCGEREDGGLTRFGERVVAEMERVGMLVDLSHTGRRTSLDALAIATKPMVFTHSNAAAVHPHWRNLTDEQIRACAATGGLVGISGSSGYLGDDRGSTEAILRHIDHIAGLVGPAHVGMGLDIVFDEAALNAYIRARPEEWPGTEAPDWPGFHYAQPEQVPRLTEALLGRGYAEDAVRAILGENYLRVCRQVWR